MAKQTVAVIGAGCAGLAALKNFKEEGFEVSLFEKRDTIGGVWAFTEDIKTTTVVSDTIVNVSKFGNSFTDFPYPDDYPAHPTALQFLKYLESYVSHFNLSPHIQLSTPVQWVRRNDDNTKWRVCIQPIGKDSKEVVSEFDKIAMCTGPHIHSVLPRLDGAAEFKGKIVHTQAYKRPSDFKDMNVVVLGIGNSAADTSTQLIGHAKKIYLSHRGGVKIFPRRYAGMPLDLVLTRQTNAVKFTLDKYAPSLAAWVFDQYTDFFLRNSFKFKPEWRLRPSPSLANHQPVITDNLVDSLWAGSVISVPGIQRFTGDKEILLTDGTILEDIDTVILCTGYATDFSLVPDLDLFGSDNVPKDSNTGERMPRLYHNIFPPQYANSLVFIQYIALTEGLNAVVDLVSMAAAQVFKGTYKLPSVPEMNAHIDAQHAWVHDLGKKDTVYSGIVRPGPFWYFLNDAAGTGVNEKLGYGWEGWKFWWSDPKLCSMLMKGVMTPFMYRLFDGRRKKWDEAREAILHINEHAKPFRIGER